MGGTAISLDTGGDLISRYARVTVYCCSRPVKVDDGSSYALEEVGPVGDEFFGDGAGVIGLTLPRGEGGGCRRLALRLARMLEQDSPSLIERVASVLIAEPFTPGGRPSAMVTFERASGL